jgi:hypothetical protein
LTRGQATSSPSDTPNKISFRVNYRIWLKMVAKSLNSGRLGGEIVAHSR